MIEILKKENEILRKQLESLNSGKEKNNYDTLLAMLEVLSMQRKKIYSIKKGKLLFFNIFYLVRKCNNVRRKRGINENFKR